MSSIYTIFRGYIMDENDKLLWNEAKESLKIGSLEELADILGYAKTTVNNWYSGGFSKIVRMKINELLQKHSNNTMLVRENDDIALVSYYPDIQAAGGYGAINGHFDVELIPISKVFLSTMFGLTNFSGLDVIRVIGDSMEPYIHNGETILLQRTNQARNNQIVVARVGDEVLVKRFLRDPLGSWIKLTSENQYYPDIDLKKKDMNKLEIIGVVCGRFRPF